MQTLSAILYSQKSNQEVYSDLDMGRLSDAQLAKKLDKEMIDIQTNLAGIISGEIQPQFTFKGEYYYPFYIS